MKKSISYLLILLLFSCAPQIRQPSTSNLESGKLDELPRGAKLIDNKNVSPLFVKNNKLFCLIESDDSIRIMIYSNKGRLLDSISIATGRDDKGFISGTIHGLFLDNNENMWMLSRLGPICYNKNGNVSFFDSFPANDQFNNIIQGRGNEIVLFAASGSYKTTDLGNTWHQFDSSFPNIQTPISIMLNGDTTWNKLGNASINSIYLDYKGTFWAGSAFGLLYTDNNMESWHIYDKMSFADTSLHTSCPACVTIIGINPGGDMLIGSPGEVFWIRRHNDKEFKRIYKAKSDYPDNQNYTRGMFFSDHFIAYIDVNLRTWSYLKSGLFSEWMESYIKLSKDFGKSWKKFRLGRGIEIFDITHIKSAFFLNTSKGLVKIPTEYFK